MPENWAIAAARSRMQDSENAGIIAMCLLVKRHAKEKIILGVETGGNG